MPDFVPGLEGIIAFETEIAEPDKDGGALRYRGVDIEDLVGHVTFGNVWALLVDGKFGAGRGAPRLPSHEDVFVARKPLVIVVLPIHFRPVVAAVDGGPALGTAGRTHH